MRKKIVRNGHLPFVVGVIATLLYCGAAPAQVQPAQSFALNNYVRVLDGQWEGIRYASDGNVYFGSSSQGAHHGASFFKYDPRTGILTMLAEDITTICGEDPQTNPQGKLHSDFVEANGWIYFSTHFGNDLPGSYATYTGSHVVGYELATGRFRDYGIIFPNYDSYSGIGVDPVRNYVYVFVTGESPGQVSYLFRIDTVTGTKINLGQVGGQYYSCLWLFVDQRGDVWFSVQYQNGDLHRVHADTGAIDTYRNALPPVYLWNVEQVDPSASSQANRYIQWMQRLDGNRAVFALAGGGMLYMFDSSQPIGSGLEFTNLKHIGYNYIGMAVGNNRVFYYQRANRGYGHQGDETPDGIKDFHLLSVSLNAADGFAIYDHGLLRDQDGRLVWRVPAMMTDGNTRVFMTGDWWTIPGDLGTLRYEYSNGVESYVQLPRGEFFAVANVDFSNPIAVSVAPTTPGTLSAGQAQQFSATVQGTTNQMVNWSLSPNVGTISPTGLYNAPATIQYSQVVTVTASANADTAKTATATLNLIGSSPPPSCPCTIWNGSATPRMLDAGAGGAVELGVKFKSDIDGYITGVRFYKSSNNTGTHVGNLWSSGGTLLASATFSGESGSGWQQMNFSSPVHITANTVYVVSYHTNVSHFSLDLNGFVSAGVDNPPLHALANGASGGNGVYVYSSSSAFPTNTYQAANYWVDAVFSTAPPPPVTCPCTIWSSNATPTTIDAGPGGAVELGVKFTADNNGSITGLRFYKGANNTGTHVANLWSSSGALLATATFSGESASGWQQVNFSLAVPVTAGTVYVASYHTDVSHFSVDLNGFASSVDNAPLHALANGTSGGNGVYAYSNGSVFPSNTYQAANYWVDVLFQ